MGFRNCILSFLMTITLMSFGQNNIMPLWENEVPNSQPSDEKQQNEIDGVLRISKVQIPTLEVFMPSKKNANGKAVVICPGGGYRILSYEWEGIDVAKWFVSKGITAFVLKYRLPQSKSIIVQHQAPLQDAQRAIRLVRYNSGKWGISKDKIGVIGFSAGGHLASTLGTQFDRETLEKLDDIDKETARPDFMMLIYPVISMKNSITHKGSRNNLLGINPNNELVEEFSNELHVKKNTPRTFIVHSADDKSVPVENSLNLYKALKDANIATEMHIYPSGGHGYGLAINTPYLNTWTDRLADWLKTF